MTPFEVIAFALLGLMVIAFALAGAALLWMAGQERRTIEALGATPCPVCRQILGKTAVNEGRLRALELIEAARDESEEPSTEHVLSEWTIICPHCRSELHFDVARRAWLSVTHPHQAE